MTDPIADMLTRMRNANVAMHDEVAMPSSKLKERRPRSCSARATSPTGMSAGADPGPGYPLTIRLKYSPERERTISGHPPDLQAGPAGLLARPRRSPGCWAGSASPLSTNQGLMSDRERRSVGWAVRSLCHVCGEELRTCRDRQDAHPRPLRGDRGHRRPSRHR